ncbi:MBL fold metallo-hydrolase [Pistricoccus aurantiacus]|uniref:MBL fold metallo-hydrolase n=1 Tax=Pistricoccus aurantiacus TaxID=1883414 RepID=A0A5B8SUW9_9GAMM|nr:MBL fold metallo-hydrolase [Pistricoccus aurantiacus]QEA38733.1 MBL fold metallo-hydrolase [Pistricoccus aurantiacus]
MLKKRTLTTALLLAAAGPAMAFTHTGKDVDKSMFEGREIAPDPWADQCDVERSLVPIEGKENLYRHTNNTFPATHSGLVLIQDEGALVIDAGNRCAAEWLRDEIRERFDKEITLAILTHAHFDHLAGSSVYQEAGAEIIAQRNALEPIIGEKMPVAEPTITFDEEMTVTFGDYEVLLHHEPAGNHSNSMVQVWIPELSAMQCTDVCQSETFPYMDFLDFYYPGWIETLDWVIDKNPDVIDVGHYSPATAEDQVALRDYMTELHDQVLELHREGMPWDQLWRNVTAGNEHKDDWFGYEYMRVHNIRGMFRWVDNHRRGLW